jgi:hypothetical protein
MLLVMLEVWRRSAAAVLAPRIPTVWNRTNLDELRRWGGEFQKELRTQIFSPLLGSQTPYFGLVEGPASFLFLPPAGWLA